MNTLIKTLGEICSLQRTEKKLLLVPSLAEGHLLLESLGRYAGAWLNVHPVTPLDLAKKMAVPVLSSAGTRVMESGENLWLIGETLREMVAAGAMKYFLPLQDADLPKILAASVNELRLAGVSGADLDASMFCTAEKGREIIALLSGYEKQLADRKLADTAGVYQAALSRIKSGISRLDEILLIPETLALPRLSYEFLKAYPARKRIVLPADPVPGLPPPGAPPYRFPAEQAGEMGPFSLLFAPPDDTKVPGPELFHAYGPANEIREMIRLITEANLSLDEVAVCLADYHGYVPLAYTLCLELGIPASFAGGIPIGFTRPGRLALDLVQWMQERYSSLFLYRILAGGTLETKAGAGMARLLRKAGIGWGRERYLRRLDELISTLEHKAEAAQKEDGDNYKYYTDGINRAKSLKELAENLLQHLPCADENGYMDMQALCRGLVTLLKRYCKKETPEDRQALACLEERITEIARANPGVLPEKQALRRLFGELEGTSTPGSLPKPGHLHFYDRNSSLFGMRDTTFVLGLDAAAFPGGGNQDPVLLDSERRQISPHLPLLAHEPEERLYHMARVLVSRRGRLVLSYSAFDPVENRPSFPAAILLQAFRLKTGNPSADYSNLAEELGAPAGYAGRVALSIDEWWLKAGLSNLYRRGPEPVEACYTGFYHGRLAEEQRCSPAFTVYDGLVEAAAELDPRAGDDAYVSATRFETLASCPYAYFLRYVLHAEPPRDVEYDPGTWLDHLTRGSLLHEIYCTYLREAYPPGKPPRPSPERLRAIAAEQIEKTRELVPPPSDLIFEQEKEDLLAGLEVFLRMEENAISVPVFLEIPFGFGVEECARAGLGLPGAVTLELPGGGNIKICGRIDRLDKTGPHTYRVYDYKTGSAYGFEENKNLKQGRQIQHALYAHAAETILRLTGFDPEARVESAGYLFPTEKGEGMRIERLFRRKGVLEVLEKGLNLLAAGVFRVAEDQDMCRFCDYSPVCRSPVAVQRAKNKEHPALAHWKELQEYE